MRICVCGAPRQRKSTFVSDFVKNWPNYKVGDSPLVNMLASTYNVGKRSNKANQKTLAYSTLSELRKYRKDDCVIFDGSPLDVLCHTLWLRSNDKGKVDDDFIAEVISQVKKSMSYIDIIFFIPITKAAGDVSVDKSSVFSYEVDNILKAVKYDWLVNSKSNIFDNDDRPVIIDVFGTPEQRIEISKLYITDSGEQYGEGSIITDEDIKLMESLKPIKNTK